MFFPLVWSEFTWTETLKMEFKRVSWRSLRNSQIQHTYWKSSFIKLFFLAVKSGFKIIEVDEFNKKETQYQHGLDIWKWSCLYDAKNSNWKVKRFVCNFKKRDWKVVIRPENTNIYICRIYSRSNRLFKFQMWLVFCKSYYNLQWCKISFYWDYQTKFWKRRNDDHNCTIYIAEYFPVRLFIYWVNSRFKRYLRNLK